MSEKLFGFDKDWHNNACLNYTTDAMYSYIEGYRKAGDLLVWAAMKNNSDLDHLVYPIAFLYRQNIELRLKDIMRHLKFVLGATFDFDKMHKIELLWSKVDKLMTRIIDEIDDGVDGFILDTDRALIGAAIEEFSSIDPDSTAFRYPEDTRGNTNLPSLKHINIRQLAEQVASMGESLSKYEAVAAFLFDRKLQMESIDKENVE